MTKKNKYKRNYLNYFDDGGKLGNILIGTGMGAAGNIGGNLISDGKSSGVGNTIGSLGNTIGGAAMAVNPIVGGAIMAGSKVLGGITNALFGSKLNNERIALALNEINNALNFTGNALNFDDLSLMSLNAPAIAGFKRKDIGSDGLFSNKAKNKYKELLADKQYAENWVDRSILNNATNLQQGLANTLLLNYAAFGGPLDYGFDGALGYDLANQLLGINAMKAMSLNRQYSVPNMGLNTFAEGGKIYIKPENRGKFTALKERTGKSATWFKEHGTPALKKMATFALNARKWKHEDGGNLNESNSNDSNNSLSDKTQRFLDSIGYGDTPLSAIVPEEYKNIADGVWGGLELFTPLGTAMGIADVANDIRNIYHKDNISTSDLGNLMLDASGFIPGGRVLKKAAKTILKVLPKKAEKLYEFADNLTYTTPKGIKQVKKRVNDAKDFSNKAEKAAVDAIISRNNLEMFKAAMKAREAVRFNLGILGGVNKALDSNAIRYNTTKNILLKGDGINDMFGIMGSIEDEVNKKAFGGDLITNGAVFSNNVNVISNGDSHENNIYGGVLLGVDNLGIPNLVEENEVIWNDYVFSDRIKVPKTVKEKLKLRGNKDMTFADAANKILKMTEERPNDPISMETMDINLTRLALEQEVLRQKRNLGQEGRKYAEGGTKKKKTTIPAFTLNTGWQDLFNDSRLDTMLMTNTANPLGLTKDDFAKVGMVDADPYANLTFNDNRNNNNNNNYATWLRYAPVAGSAIGLTLTLLNSPDYSRADALALYAQNAGLFEPITYEPLGNYLTYTPTDVNYLANRAAALAGATRRQIMNTAGGNRAAAVGSLLAADYNAQLALGELLRLAEEANFGRRAQVESFNRATNQANSEMALKAAMANQEARLRASQMGLSGYTAAMLMKDAIDALRNASLNANLTALFDNLGDIGREEMTRRMVMENPALLYDYYGRYKGNKSAKGGKINRKKRGGFTY